MKMPPFSRLCRILHVRGRLHSKVRPHKPLVQALLEVLARVFRPQKQPVLNWSSRAVQPHKCGHKVTRVQRSRRSRPLNRLVVASFNQHNFGASLGKPVLEQPFRRLNKPVSWVCQQNSLRRRLAFRQVNLVCPPNSRPQQTPRNLLKWVCQQKRLQPALVFLLSSLADNWRVKRLSWALLAHNSRRLWPSRLRGLVSLPSSLLHRLPSRAANWVRRKHSLVYLVHKRAVNWVFKASRRKPLWRARWETSVFSTASLVYRAVKPSASLGCKQVKHWVHWGFSKLALVNCRNRPGFGTFRLSTSLGNSSRLSSRLLWKPNVKAIWLNYTSRISVCHICQTFIRVLRPRSKRLLLRLHPVYHQPSSLWV